jgi:hypothetical protein
VTAASRGLRAALTAALATTCLLLAAGPADASPAVQYGVQDDAWLRYGPGTLESRLSELTRLGVDVVRFTVRWDTVARRRPATPRDPRDPAYSWSSADQVLQGLRSRGISAVVTLYGTPGWANGGLPPNHAPTSASSFGNFAHAAATRYSWVRHWTVWNEPNQPAWLRPTSARTYVSRLLNPAYAQIHAAIPDALVGGGVTAARGGAGGVAPVPWIRAMGAADARLDAYAHHPYPSRPQAETPWGPPCNHCATLTMADLERLQAEVRRAFGPKRIWLTEYGYQTNPPDTLLGVPYATQAHYVASAMRRAYLAPLVDMLVFFLVRDDTAPTGWQSGFFTADGAEKPSHSAFRLPLTQVSRTDARVTVWGQVRNGNGRRPFRLRRFEGGRWTWLGGTRMTDERGFFTATVTTGRGALLQAWAPGSTGYGIALRIG